MIKPHIYKSPPFVLEKLHHLLVMLREEKNKFERIAAVITDKQYSKTISFFAQESNQYAREIWSQISTLSGGSSYSPADWGNEPEPSGVEEVLNEDDALLYCVECEKDMIKAYREVLNEPFLMEGLRSIMRYQLNGIMYAFLQLKLLGSTIR